MNDFGRCRMTLLVDDVTGHHLSVSTCRWAGGVVMKTGEGVQMDERLFNVAVIVFDGPPPTASRRGFHHQDAHSFACRSSAARLRTCDFVRNKLFRPDVMPESNGSEWEFGLGRMLIRGAPAHDVAEVNF